MKEFTKLRLENKWKGNSITVWLSDDMISMGDHLVFKEKSASRVDTRIFLGMSVFLCAQSYNDRVLRFYEKLKENASFILVGLIDFGDEVGWKWNHRTGECEL